MFSASSNLTSSSVTEKSVRFSDRDLILSTPEPRPPPPLAAVNGRWPFIRPYHHHQHPHQHCVSGANGSDVSNCRTKETMAAGGSSQPKVKSILKTDGFKSCPDVTSFMLDNDDGTLVWDMICKALFENHFLWARQWAAVRQVFPKRC